MRVSNTADRLKQIMAERNLKQIDLLNAVRPFCRAHGVKMNRSDISQYVNGKVQPSQEKLSIFSMAFDVSEPWLMGYDNDESDGDDLDQAAMPQSIQTEIIYSSPSSGDESTDDLRRQIHEYIDSLSDDELRAMTIILRIPID